MTECAMARPWPLPLPTALVVKNGSNTFGRMASGMPPPVSLTRISAKSPCLRVPMRMAPLPPEPFTTSAIACAAFTIRLRITWLNSPATHGTGGMPGSKSVVRSATYFHSLRDTRIVLSMAWWMSIGIFSAGPGCENRFMARTIPATRSTPSCICAMALGISPRRYGDVDVIGRVCRSRRRLQFDHPEQILKCARQKLGVVADVLDRGVDFVSDACR
jgi:hypothetical protein